MLRSRTFTTTGDPRVENGNSAVPKISIRLPSTRYQGSKAKLVQWIWDCLKDLEFSTVLDMFGGTGVVSFMFKQMGKIVTYNDYLLSNYIMGLALIENKYTHLPFSEAEQLFVKYPDRFYSDFIQSTFHDIYYTDEENEWLDITVQNIENLECPYKKALAYSALFQACLVKRPFNLFHRKNLYLRFAKVARSFGNKATWDRFFHEHFLSFIAEIDSLVFDNGKTNVALNREASEVEAGFDLVYIDPPYTSSKAVTVDYYYFYHFLEGLADYWNWPRGVDYARKHKPLRHRPNPWNEPSRIRGALRELFYRHKDSIIAVSYRADGIPSIPEIASDLRDLNKRVNVCFQNDYKYVLSNGTKTEALLIAE